MNTKDKVKMINELCMRADCLFIVERLLNARMGNDDLAKEVAKVQKTVAKLSARAREQSRLALLAGLEDSEDVEQVSDDKGIKFRKKPVVIEAVQYTGDNSERIKEFAKEYVFIDLDKVPYIYTLEGTMRVDVGDFVIKGIMGEFYPCKKEIFERTYEAVGSRDSDPKQMLEDNLKRMMEEHE